MKIIKKFILIPIVLILASSCDGFLDKTDPTVLVVDKFYKNEAEVEQAVNGVYALLQDYFNIQWQFTEYISDNTTLEFNVGDRGQGPSLEAIEYWQYNPGTQNFSSLYNTSYYIIANINTLLYNLDQIEIDQEVKDQAIGQVKFIRAQMYFDLVRSFGNVAIIETPIKSPQEAFLAVRKPEADVYQFILQDLDDAVQKLPTNYPSTKAGKATLGAGLTLLAKVYLTQKNYTECLSTLNKILPLGYTLVNNYADIFETSNKNNSESIWEIQYLGLSTGGVNSSFIYTFAPRSSNGSVINFPGQNGGGWNIPTNEIIALYENGDARKDASLKEGYFDQSGVWIHVPYINKYNHEHTIRGASDDNWPVYRYSDVLLMLAETINEISGPSGEAFEYLNMVRERAELPALSGLDKSGFRNAIWKERRIELAFENHRWFDLKRTRTNSELIELLKAHGRSEIAKPTTDRGGIPFSNGDYQIEEYQLLFPIPADQIRINPNIQQNPGY
jgi:hypothetical protein